MSSDFSHGTLLPDLAGAAMALGPEEAAGNADAADAQSVAALKQWFGTEFTLLDAASGELLHVAAGQPRWDGAAWREACQTAASRRQPIIDRLTTLLVLALPWDDAGDDTAPTRRVAVGMFVTPEALGTADVLQAALALDVEPDTLEQWARRQTPVAAETLQRLARLVLAERTKQRRVTELESEIDKLSQHLCHTYEEISLIYQLTDNLTLSRREHDLARKALQWLSEIVPAEGFALQRVARGVGPMQRPELVTHGQCPITNAHLAHLIDELGLNASRKFLIANRAMTSRPDWPAPEVREMIVVPLMRGC
jgi:hypothetical protein